MKTLLLAGAWGGLVCVGAAVVDGGTSAGNPARPQAATATATATNAAELAWGEAPKVFPKGAQMAVLHGDPFKKGAYTARLKMPAGYKIPAHWHTLDEQLTIVSGDFILTMDDGTHELAAGAYHFLPGRMHHAAEARGDTVVQVSAMGPFDMHYLNPADDPGNQAAAAK
jgi:quercetin dioxygenase-like cupin family protein